MKILTWNIQRPRKVNKSILDKLAEFDADILVLTETNSTINPGKKYFCVATETLLKGYDGIDYKSEENRTTIWTKYKIETDHKTYDSFTSVCNTIQTPNGSLKVYGTIIGVFGGLGERFKNDLKSQILDFETLCENSFCIIGDLNVTFSGRIYPSNEAKNKLNAIFEKLDLTNLTSNLENNVDHIILSNDFLKNKSVIIETWNHDKKLSDHIGICLSLK